MLATKRTLLIIFSALLIFWMSFHSEFVQASVASSGVNEPAVASEPTQIPEARTQPTKPVRYNRDIRPILSDRCFKCHGPDSASRQADLRLDLPPQLVGKDDAPAAIVPGSAAQSEVLRRISSDDPEEMMPPPDSHKKQLTPEEIELVRQWIDQGAQYEAHWAFVAPTRPTPPEIKNGAFRTNPIDRFIIAQLEQENVVPSPEVDRATYARRLYLDLTGLPPTPEEVDAFVNEATQRAPELALLRQLLTTEPYRSRYAEHMASRWLDAARYADTIGIHTDAGRQMWLWRDWVLNAYRNNMPFDQFLTEQLAGDLIPGATLEQKVASGFNRNHVMTDEGGAINEEYLVEYAVDRVSTTASVFLGLTLGCARCHEHKFDPISQEEFYSLYAFFNSLEEPGLYSQQPNPNRAFEPFLSVPSDEQRAELQKIEERLAEARLGLEQVDPAEATLEKGFFTQASEAAGWASVRTDVVSATSENGANLTISPEGSISASGENPAADVHTITLQTSGANLNVIALEALTHPSLTEGRVGRAPNGNAVLSDIQAEAVSRADPTQRRKIHFRWAWADYEQANGDYVIINAIDSNPQSGWAVGSHLRAGPRVALLLADEAFGYEGGTEVIVRLSYKSVNFQHALGHVRLSLGRIDDATAANLPLAESAWYLAGPFATSSGQSPYDHNHGPELDPIIDLNKEFGDAKVQWQYKIEFKDDALNKLAAGTNVSYLGRRIFSATACKVNIALGSDDGFELYVNGQSVKQRKVERGLKANQDLAEVPLKAGENYLVLKVINTGGDAGFFYRHDPSETQWPRDLVMALAPPSALGSESAKRLTEAWRVRYSPGYRQAQSLIAELEQQKAAIEKTTPLTMVMQELSQPRTTYVLTRGAYDKPDMQRPVERNIPAALGTWDADHPRNRLGLAQWMISADNPLVARVAVNRLWEHFFGIGLVRTSEDFGMQGEWPSHPELLDWLAVELRESNWDIQRIIRLIVTSQTYRQSSRVRLDVRERDPDNRWLSYFPRRRLIAEQVRDQALYTSGLLVEKLGGPSVKPYQPDGIWSEVAMPASNTRNYERGKGTDLWRRSVYTYWKRACPPPSLQTFDAPTRESCTIRRSSTNTPLQALVLWNDPQFVEAARVLAQRSMNESSDDAQRIATMFRRCTGRAPDDQEASRLAVALAKFRGEFASAESDAKSILAIGDSPVPPERSVTELAAWTMVANAILNLNETIVVN